MLKKLNLLKVFIVSVFMLSSLGIYASTDDLTVRFLKKAGDFFAIGDFENAYKNVNTAMAMFYEDFDEKDKDYQGVIDFARAVYLKKLNYLINNYDELDFFEVKLNLEKYSFLRNNEIDNAVYNLEHLDVESIKKIKNKNTDTNIKKEYDKNVDYNVSTDLLFSEALDSAFEKSMEETKRSASIVAFVIIAISAIVLVVIIFVVVICKKGFSKQQIQQEQYIQAFKTMSSSYTGSQYLLGGITDIYGNKAPLKYAGSSNLKKIAGVPDINFNEKDENEFKELAVKCEELGSKIDAVTGRKNNSKNVSEIVYKLSLQLGLSADLSMVNFCAAMVYDAGFLGVDPALLSSDVLSDDEKANLNIHVSLSDKYLSFVPQKYYGIFSDAAMKHHENMDGTGYPYGLKGYKIPLIARLIRVAESYVSISSRRIYRAPSDKETAVAQLKSEPEFYDNDIVEALDKIV